MREISTERLRRIRSFAQLVEFLRDELNWPLDAEEIENLTFEYEPDELGIDPETAVKITQIKQLRPLSADQPWGIFYVEFEPKRLPVVVLRRILQKLVIKKRQSTQSPHRQAWDLHDLLFISSCGETNQRSLTFAHFSEDEESKLPTLRVIGWDAQDTPLHIDRCIAELGCLKYDEQTEPDQWRQQWSRAFTLEHREVIRTSKALAKKLAALATRIRNRVNKVLAVESDKGPVRQLYKAFQETLIHDLTEDDFADMYAQTITYGLFSTKKSRPAGLVAENLVEMVPRTNPFLRELLSTFLSVGGRKGKIDFDELGIDDVVQTLRNTDMDAVLRDFGDSKPEEDPVIHFYEDFLKEYDARKKVQRGVFYTPQPVVSYIVRSVHELLQTEFGLEDGLASTVTWGQMIEHHPMMKLPTVKAKQAKSPDLVDEPIDPQTPFVQILDPAVGTATFLVEVIDVIRRTMLAKWRKEGRLELEFPRLWDDYVPKHLLPRLYGYELMMAPYAIAHMKIGLKLYETGYRFGSNERARIYLTNALEPAQDFSDRLAFDAPALAHEAHAVNAIKRCQRFTVVIGNPPYSGVSANRGEWITDLIDLYRFVDGQPLDEKKVWLKNDYVKFLRLCQLTTDNSGAGIVGLITDHSYLDSPTFRGLRSSLLRSFPGARLLNLHGNSKRREVNPNGGSDENVFDITQGVAIGLFVQHSRTKSCVCYADIWGERSRKYEQLLGSSASTTSWSLVPAKPSFYLLTPVTDATDKEYTSGWLITDVFSLGSNGVQTSRDSLVLAPSPKELAERFAWIRSNTVTDAEICETCETENKSFWCLADARSALMKDQDWKKHIVGYTYRPFDNCWLYASSDFVHRLRREVMQHMEYPNVALCVGRAGLVVEGTWNLVFCTNTICDHNLFYRGSSLNCPLYRYHASDEFHAQKQAKTRTRSHNISRQFVSALSRCLSVDLDTDHDLPKGVAPEDIFAYAYAVFHSPEYRRRYAEFLKIDFPRLPLTSSLNLFRSLSKLGGELISLHLTASPKLDKPITKWKGATPSSEVGKVSYGDGTVWIDKGKTEGFRAVPEDVWQFHIGGYQICDKWLKDRKGRQLSEDDIAHYQKIVVALAETIKIMAQIDKTIEAHGGWPIK